MVRPSRCDARVDLELLIKGADRTITIPHVRPRSVRWTRNRPGLPDECAVEIDARYLPFDLDILDGIQLQAWLYEHGEPELCAIGDPGYFAGVVQNLNGDDTETTAFGLAAVDFTYFPSHHELTPADIRRIDLSASPLLEQVVDILISFMPGGETWRVESVGERAVGQRDVRRAFAYVRTVTVTDPVTQQAKKVRRAASHFVSHFGANEITIWDAVTRLCAYLGAIPEVGISQVDGGPAIFLIDAEEYQTSSALRPFRRAGRPYRRLLEGEGAGPVTVERELVTGRKVPDFVTVASTDRTTGQIISATWPPDYAPRGLFGRAGARSSSGSYQTAHGVTDTAQLQRLARLSYQNARRRRQALTVPVTRTWSDGGSPEDPDLLDLAPGAAVQLRRLNEDSRERGAGRELLALGLSPRDVAVIEAASDALDTSGLYQVSEVSHDWSADAGYTGSISLRRFLTAQEVDGA